MGQPVPLVAGLFAIIMTSGVQALMAADRDLLMSAGPELRLERVRQSTRSMLLEPSMSLAGDHDVIGHRMPHIRNFAAVPQVAVEMQPDATMSWSSLHRLEGSTRLSLISRVLVVEREAGAEEPLLPGNGLDGIDDESMASDTVAGDWRGLGRDTAFFLGYEAVVAGILYLLPESATQWTNEQKRTSMSRWWENVQNPTWDKDNLYVNYLGHPYFGAIAYIRARERQFGAFGAFWYAALLSGLYEFGVEALFEQPSYQDLIITPIAGAFLGALLFEPIRNYIRGKPERQWYDHLTLAVTDPLGTSNMLVERLFGIQRDVQVHVHFPGMAPYVPFSESIPGALAQSKAARYRFYGVGITLAF